MKQIMDTTGAVLNSEREYDIAGNTKIELGQVVKLVDGLVVAALAAETGAILGYAAEAHSGVEEAMNTRANGTKIVVQDAPSAVAESPAPKLIATGGGATTVKAGGVAEFAANAFKGGYIKGPDGCVRLISASAVASGVLTITAGSWVTPTAGDVYTLFPPMGFVGGNLNAEGTKLVLTATAALPIQVTGRNEAEGTIYTTAVKHQLAATR